MKKVTFQGTKTSKLAANELRHINLNGSEVPYTLMRCRRKTIGMRVSSEGLTVRIPMKESLSWVESVLQKRSDWIVTKLDEWKNRKPARPTWEAGAIFPLLGGTVAGDGYRRRIGADGAGRRERRKQG